MEQSLVISQIKKLITEANQSIASKNYKDVHDKYREIAKLCQKIGDNVNAQKYEEAAQRFLAKAKKIDQHKKELRKAIDQAVDTAQLAYKHQEYRKVSDIYFQVAQMLHELDDDVSAEKFSSAARQFRERAALEEAQKQMVQQLPKAVQESASVKPIDDSTIVFMETSQYEKPRPPLSQMAKTQKTQAQETFQPPAKTPEGLSKSALSSFKINVNKLDEFIAQMSFNCPHCGAKISGSMKVCPNCNARLST
ncbi:MAG: zinc ribbon domain-containing protein [Candidatus Helarchaeota archaeon]